MRYIQGQGSSVNSGTIRLYSPLLDLIVKWGEEYSENDSLVIHLGGHLDLRRSRTSQRKVIKLISFDFEEIVFFVI